MCAAVDLDAAFRVGFDNHIAAFAVETGEKLGIALNERDLATHRFEIVRHFEGDSSAAEHGDALWQCIGIQNVITGPVAAFGESGHVGNGNFGAGGDAEAA